jgi:hypothetical protein
MPIAANEYLQRWITQVRLSFFPPGVIEMTLMSSS